MEYNGVCGRISHLARARAPDADSEGCWDAGSSARVHRLQLLPPVDQTQGSTKIHRDVQGLICEDLTRLLQLLQLLLFLKAPPLRSSANWHGLWLGLWLGLCF